MWRVLCVALGALTIVVADAPGTPGHADFIGHGAPVRDVTLSSDGVYAATAGFDDLAILWSTETGEQITRFYGHEAGVNAVAFLPPATEQTLPRVVSVSDDGTARLWDSVTGEVKTVFEGHEKKVVTIAVSSDGSTIATGSWDRTVRVWDVVSGDQLFQFDGHTDSVNSVIFSPDGQSVLSAGYDGAIHVWKLDGSDSYRFAKPGFPVNSIAITPDGETLVSGSADQIVRVWDVESRKMQRELTGHEGAILSVSVSDTGDLIASGGVGGAMFIWDAGDVPRLQMQVPHYRAVWALDFQAGSEVIYAAGIDSVVRGWHVETGESIIGEATAFQPVARVSAALADSEDPFERGSYQFRKCAICHSLKEDGIARSGPTLAGVFGRQAGTYPGYEYSNALNGSDVIWNAETISRLFDIGPDQMFPGTKMPIQRLTNPKDREDLVYYLREATDVPE